MTWNKAALGAAMALGMGAVACSGVDTDPTMPGSEARTAGLALTSDTLGNTDVAGMRFTVDGCSGTASAGYSEVVEKDLEDLYLPGGISAFEDKPYDADSQHLFSDHYFLLAAGCYDVVVQPLQLVGGNYQDSSDCASAHKDGVTVEDGKTREILLISQCKGPENGGLDVIGTINHPPEITNVEFKDYACVDAGGALSGEHGIGIEKQPFMEWLYTEADLENMERVRPAFGNDGLFNPCKLLPRGTGCGEMAHQSGAMAAAGPEAYI